MVRPPWSFSSLIISDWEMPGIDGLELCRRVRSAQGTYHVHFIMQTVHAGNDELKRAFDAGVDDFVRKPFTEGDLHSRLRAAMRSIALHDELARRNRGSQELNAQLTSVNQRLEMLAITDDLTGLYNRRQAMHRLEEDWAASHQLRRAISVVLIDIDHFKQINDLHGHAIGDFVLRRLADVLRGCLRATDIIARFGGEEFLIILPNQTQQEAEVCAQRCLHAVEKHPFDTEELKLRVTISAGIACRRSEMQQCSDLLAEADQALYAAKHAGRNTVRTARVDTPAPVSASSASTAA
jgi:diguanylate cyclase (GGDEF)-like protein